MYSDDGIFKKHHWLTHMPGSRDAIASKKQVILGFGKYIIYYQILHLHNVS